MGADISQMVLIRGNIRQQYLPFVLKPGSNLNANVKDDHDLKDGPQLFSFRNKKADQYKAGFGRLNICPSVMRSPEFGLLFNKDMSNQLLYDYDSKNQITIDSIFNQMPGMQIREFQVDAKLDQFINLFFELFQSAKGLFKEIKLSDIVSLEKNAARSRWIDMFGEILKTCWDYCINQGAFEKGPNMMQDASGQSRWDIATNVAADALKNMALIATAPVRLAGQAIGVGAAAAVEAIAGIDLDTYLMNFPFMMYYRLQSCTSLNIYELPYAGEQMWSSDGSEGWRGKYMALKDLIDGNKDNNSNSGMMGKVVGLFTGGWSDLINRVKINYMPKWDPTGDGSLESMTVTFDLFNDTAEAAMKNFIFVNTIIPNNLWMQYGMLKHSPCLYDVKIDGLKRMFLCSGKFSVKSNGLMRTPSKQWINDLCLKHANNSGGKTSGCWDPLQLINDIIQHNLIKIPDVYTVEMTFSSLIPANFNNFLYNYSRNSSIELYANNDAHYPSVIGEVLGAIKTDLSKEIETVIDKGNQDIANAHADAEKK